MFGLKIMMEFEKVLWVVTSLAVATWTSDACVPGVILWKHPLLNPGKGLNVIIY